MRSGSNRQAVFLLIFGGVTFLLVGAAYWVITFVYREVRVETALTPAQARLSDLYVNYSVDPESYISAESYLAMGRYQREYPQPQNIQVLVGESTTEVIGYMINYFSGGLGVDCTHCHSLENFAAEEWGDPVAEANRATARQHAYMAQDLNQNWLPELASLTEDKHPSGTQIICATCHNGQAQPVTWPGDIASIPDTLRLPDEPVAADTIDILNVNGRTDISLDTVDYHQDLMYYMNYSMNVGCTHCHNSRYFPSWEVPAKYYAIYMVQMTQYIDEEWGHVLNGSEASCLMCHQQAVIPPGGARNVDVMPEALVAQPAAVADAGE